MTTSVYVIGRKNEDDMLYHKIGISDDPAKRAKQLSSQTGFDLDVKYVWRCDTREEAANIEDVCHIYAEANRLNGEWFSLDKKEAVSIVNNAWQLLIEENGLINIKAFKAERKSRHSLYDGNIPSYFEKMNSLIETMREIFEDREDPNGGRHGVVWYHRPDLGAYMVRINYEEAVRIFGFPEKSRYVSAEGKQYFCELDINALSIAINVFEQLYPNIQYEPCVSLYKKRDANWTAYYENALFIAQGPVTPICTQYGRPPRVDFVPYSPNPTNNTST